MKFALVLVAALVGATASKGCSSKMKVTYYDDMYCQTVDDEGSESVAGWDDGECEKNDEYEGYNTWQCTSIGVKENIFSDDLCGTK